MNSKHSAPVAHPEFTKNSRSLELEILRANPGTILFLVGLSGAGKTWIRRTVARKLFGQLRLWPKGKLPYIEAMAILADRGYFSPKDLALAMLEQINSPDIEWLYKDPDEDPSIFIDEENAVARMRQAWMRERSPATEREAWRLAISSGRHRQLQLASIEHASLMVQNRKNGTAVQHTLNLMSIATSMGASVILTTTPEGCDLWKSYPEISRRAVYVFINPYDLQSKQGMKNFAVLLKKLAEPFTFEPIDLPLILISAIGQATQTTPGGIHRLFQRASVIAQLRGSQAISRTDLQKAFPSHAEAFALEKSAKLLCDLQTPFSHSSLKEPK